MAITMTITNPTDVYQCHYQLNYEQK